MKKTFSADPTTWYYVIYPLAEISSPARHDTREPHEVSVERHENSSAFLLVHSGDNGLDNIVRGETGCEESIPPRVGSLNSAEKRRHDVARAEQSGSDCGGVVEMVEFITERLMQPKQSGLGSTVVAYT